MDRKALLLVTLFVEGGLYLFGLLLIGGPGEFQSRFDLSWNETVYVLLLCFPMLAVLYFADRSKWPPMHQLNKEIEEKIVPIFANCNVFDLAVIAFLAGVGEELFFRGWIQGTLTNRFGIWVGVLAASVIFGLAHYLSATYAIYAGLTGLYLGLIYYVTGNLYIVMGIHALYDFIALIFLVGGGRSRETGSSAGSDIEG